MVGFALRRLALGLVVLAVLTAASFIFFASFKADVIPNGQPALREYWTWLKGVGTGSSFHGLTRPAPVFLNQHRTTMLEALGHTALLLGAAFALVLLFSVMVAVAAARWRGSPADLVIRGGSYVAWGIPAFLLALIVQKVFAGIGSSHGLGPFPLAGWPGSCPSGLGLNSGTLLQCPAAGSGGRYLLNVARYLTLPVLTLAVGFVGLHGRYLRASLLETLDSPFVTTARAKGLAEPRVLLRHALRASVATFVGGVLAEFGAVFGAAMAVDYVFELNGLGTVLVSEFPINSFAPIDIYSVQLVLLITGGLVTLSSVLGEVALMLLDPRVEAKA
jgi:peptide/nickel transport system permease protein